MAGKSGVPVLSFAFVTGFRLSPVLYLGEPQNLFLLRKTDYTDSYK